MKAHLDSFDPAAPVERAHMPPASWYASPEFYQHERRAVFASSWQPVVRRRQLARPGAYVSGCFVGEPWVVVRAEDGELRAFENVCRHKGREVITGEGTAESLVCGYHAWTYDLHGRLRHAPRISGIEQFDRAKVALPALRVEEWGPWVFVNWDRDAEPLAPQLAELTGRLDATRWSELELVATRTWTLECNWKVYVDNFLDGGYHVPYMHPTLDAQLDMKSYATEVFDGYSIQSSAPSRKDDDRIDFEAEQRIGERAIYACIHPNFMLNRYGSCLDSNHVVPLGPSRCRVDYEFYFAGTDERFAEQSIAQSEVTQQEDIEICESVQRGMLSRSYEPGRYAPRVEQAEHAFHVWLHERLSRGLGA